MIDENIYLSELDTCAVMYRVGKYNYGDSHAVPPCADGYTSCDRGAVARPLWNLGYTDQPVIPNSTSGVTVEGMLTYLPQHGFKKITNMADLKRGDIIIMFKNGRPDHTFTITEYNHKTGLCSKYDFGSTQRIRSVQPFKNVPLLEWKDKTFHCAFRVPDSVKRIKPKGQRYYIVSAKDVNYALDVNGASNEPRCNIQLYKRNNTPAQVFVMEDMKDGYVRIVNPKSGLVVDVCGGKVANKTNIWQYQWNGTPAQLWKIQKNDDGTVTFLSALNNSYVIDLSNGKVTNRQNIWLFKTNGTPAQKWHLIKA